MKDLRDAEWEAHNFHAYDYEVEISNRILIAASLGGLEIPIAIARQSGKTTSIVQTIAFLLKYAPEVLDTFFAVGFFTPQRQQVKTDRDRLVRLLYADREQYGFTMPEVNQDTVRIAYGNKEVSECYMFAVSPTSHPESKTLNMVIIEEGHKINDAIVANDIRPMAAATNGSFIWSGVAGTKRQVFKTLIEENKLGVVIPYDRVIEAKQTAFEKTNDPFHLKYKDFVEKEMERLGADSTPFKLNYKLEWCIGAGSGIALEDIEALRYRDATDPGDAYEWVSVGIDHARNKDRTWIVAIGKREEWDTPRIVWIEQLPQGLGYPQQAERVVARLQSFENAERIVAVPDSTGQGDFMGDLIEQYSHGHFDEKIGSLVRFKFTSQGKDETGVLLQQMFRHKTVQIPHATVANDPDALSGLEVELLDLEIRMNGALVTWAAPESASTSVQEDPHDDAVASLCLALAGMKRIKEAGIADVCVI